MNPVQWLLVTLIRGYQLILSPVKNALFGPSAKCRFTPTCSQYGLEAVRTHGAIKGSWLAFRRLLRCNPWGPFGPDPVPKKVERRNELKADGRDDGCKSMHFSQLLAVPKLCEDGSTHSHSQHI